MNKDKEADFDRVAARYTRILSALEDGREAIQKPENWIKGGKWNALDKDGQPCVPYSAEACRWTAGAAGGSKDGGGGLMAEEYLAKASGFRGDSYTAVAAWEEHPQTSHSDVLAGFDKAILLAEAEAGRFFLTY